MYWGEGIVSAPAPKTPRTGPGLPGLIGTYFPTPHRHMSSTWSRSARTAVAGTAVLGVVLAAWMASPENWSPLGTSNEERWADDDDPPVHFVYPTSAPDTTARYRERAEGWAAFWDRRRTVQVVPDTHATRDALPNGLVMVAGTPASSLIADLLSEQGISVRDDGAFVVGDHVYDDPMDVLLLRIASSERGEVDDIPGRVLAVGQTHAAALSYAYANPFLLSGLPAEYKLLRDGHLRAYGRLSDTPPRTAGACTLPSRPARHVDLRRGAPPTLETEHFRFFAHGTVEPSAVEAFAADRTALREAAAAPDAASPPVEKIDYHLFSRHADLRHFRASVPPVGTDLRAWLRSHFGRDRSRPSQAVRVDSATGALVAVLPDDPGSVTPTEAQRWMQSSTDAAPSSPWRAMMDVGRVAGAHASIQGRSAEAWTARLHAADAVPSLPALAFDTTLVHDSPYAQGPVAATLVSFLKHRGTAERHLRTPPSKDALRQWAPAWQQHLDSLAREHRPSSPASASLPDDLYGANVAFATGPVWGSPQGYASPAGDAALSALRDLGATAAAIVPYTPMPTADQPAALLPRRHAGGAQSDATMAHTIRRAHALGMDVLLKPQISGEVEWPGSIEMPSEAAWDTFFDRYADWMLHYALMAERYDVAVLSIGTELVDATRTHEAEWRRLIERVRAVYDGAIVYAANWGDEAERLAFADALDAVGIDSYYPLTSDTSATDAELRAGAESVADRIQAVAERTGRPVLLTEMGFPNTQGAWAHPHEKQEDKPERPAHQARATRALTAALSDTSIRGAFWWRWSPICRFDYGRFPPKAPTRNVLQDWFERTAGPAPAP